jgi:hypothetical protein
VLLEVLTVPFWVEILTSSLKSCARKPSVSTRQGTRLPCHAYVVASVQERLALSPRGSHVGLIIDGSVKNQCSLHPLPQLGSDSVLTLGSL